mmetsp:Transcript_10053/g.25805  ORF Transcript_10053/g.25805 Transcript_10053/m.25805 type:complete len:403 (-) Transcript_10053:1005-2213(-)
MVMSTSPNGAACSICTIPMLANASKWLTAQAATVLLACGATISLSVVVGSDCVVNVLTWRKKLSISSLLEVCSDAAAGAAAGSSRRLRSTIDTRSSTSSSPKPGVATAPVGDELATPTSDNRGVAHGSRDRRASSNESSLAESNDDGENEGTRPADRTAARCRGSSIGSGEKSRSPLTSPAAEYPSKSLASSDAPSPGLSSPLLSWDAASCVTGLESMILVAARRHDISALVLCMLLKTRGSNPSEPTPPIIRSRASVRERNRVLCTSRGFPSRSGAKRGRIALVSSSDESQSPGSVLSASNRLLRRTGDRFFASGCVSPSSGSVFPSKSTGELNSAWACGDIMTPGTPAAGVGGVGGVVIAGALFASMGGTPLGGDSKLVSMADARTNSPSDAADTPSPSE